MNETEKVSQDIYGEIRQSIIHVQHKVQQTVNAGMVQIYWEIGQQLDKACDGKQAEYGKGVLQQVSDKLTAEFGKGYSYANLRNMRQFYRCFPNCYALRSNLSWTHYRMLMRVADSKAREFYAEECAAAGWSSRELERQITTFAYQRTVSQQKTTERLPQTATDKGMAPYRDFIRDPYVLEFLELKPSPEFYERDIEQGIIEHLQQFLLELGRGFSFVARQKRISLDGDDFYIDLVFYNYILKCFVLIDLKLGKVKHQDIGQMQMYVNYYKANMRNEGDNEPIGIVLCAEKNEAVVKYTMGSDNSTHIYASKYMPYMPTEEELKKELRLQELPLAKEE